MDDLEEETDVFKKIEEIELVLNRQTFQLDEIIKSLELAEKRNSMLLSLEEKTDDNMKRLNQMMLELKGLIAMVRPGTYSYVTKIIENEVKSC